MPKSGPQQSTSEMKKRGFEGRTEYEETVTQNRAQHRGLNDSELAFCQGENGDDQLWDG